MEKLHYSIKINAPRQKVWDSMMNQDTYREWTLIFNPQASSYYEGDWSTGSEMLFLGPNGDGTTSGMWSKIDENRKPEFMSIRHLGEIIKGEKKPFPGSGDEVVHENYTLIEDGESTEVKIELDTIEEYKGMFEEIWPKALGKLKEISERA